MTQATLKNFLSRLLDYYGKTYRPGVALDLTEYLLEEVKDEEADMLRREVEKIPRYGEELPIIDHFEQAMKVVREKRKAMKPISPYDPHRLLSVETFESDLPPEEVHRRLAEKAPWLRGVIGVKAAGE